MNDTQKFALQGGCKATLNSSAGRNLAIEMLDGLRRRTASRPKIDDEGVEDVSAIVTNVQANTRLPADKAAYAIALVYCLAPHFATMKSLVMTRRLW